jgi:hypothetical protein
MFYIGFKSGPRVDEEGWQHAMGGIELGAESDGFAADLGVWSPQDYEAQWREGIARLAAGETSSALVTSYGGPNAPFHSMWAMWRIGNQVVLHERSIPSEAVEEPTVAACFYAAVGEHRPHSGDGPPVSEWIVPFSDVLSFLTNA